MFELMLAWQLLGSMNEGLPSIRYEPVKEEINTKDAYQEIIEQIEQILNDPDFLEKLRDKERYFQGMDDWS